MATILAGLEEDIKKYGKTAANAVKNFVDPRLQPVAPEARANIIGFQRLQDTYLKQGDTAQQAYEKARQTYGAQGSLPTRNTTTATPAAPVLPVTPVPPATETPIMERKAPTVATPMTPVVTKGGAAQTQEVLPLNRDTYDQILSKDPSKMTESEKGFLRRVQSGISEGKTLGQVLGESGGTGTAAPVMPKAPVTQADLEAKRAALAAQSTALGKTKQTEVDTRIAQEKSRINEAGQKRLEALNTSLSMSGFGRSSFGAQKQDEIMRDVTDQLAAAQAKADLEVQMFNAQQQGADDKTLASMQEQINGYTQKIYESQLAAYNKTLEQNNANKIKGNEAIANIFATLSDETKNKVKADGFDEKLSGRVGYAVDSFGKALLDEAGNKIVFSGDKGSSDVVESYASEVMNGRANISSVPDAQRDAVIQRVAGMRREKGVTSSSVNEFKAERILKKALGRNVDKEKDAGYLGYVSDRLDKGLSETEVLNELGAADAKSTSFVSGNQKLFDDMQKDVKSFVDIDRSYNGMKSIAADAARKGDSKSLAASDQALVILFNKMLDPTSVVREGEFDRTAQGQALMDQVNGFIQRVQQGGVGIGPAARADMVRIAELLHKQAQVGLGMRKDQYTGIAGDLGGDPAFVKRYFDNQLDITSGQSRIADEEKRQIESIFSPKSGTGAKELKTGSGKTFKIDLGGFKQPGQTGSTTGLKNLTSERGKSIPYTGNVGKDLNNPGNLVAGGRADKYASGYVTVTGKDGVTRRFLKFDSKDSGYEGVGEDLKAKIEGASRVISPQESLARLLDVWVGAKGASRDYKNTVSRIAGYNLNEPIEGMDYRKILEGIKEAEGA